MSATRTIPLRRAGISIPFSPAAQVHPSFTLSVSKSENRWSIRKAELDRLAHPLDKQDRAGMGVVHCSAFRATWRTSA